MTIVHKRRPGKNIKSRRALKKFEPKVFEGAKKVLLLKGQKTNDEILEVEKDLGLVLTPNTKKLAKKNAFHPFEGKQHLEFLGFKNDCSLFAFVSHSKKREHNLVLGRMHDFHLLDMFEFGVVGKDPLDMSDLHKLGGADAAAMGGKPCFVFQGSEFASDPFFVRLKNFFCDFFRGVPALQSEIVLTGVDRAIFVSLRSIDGGSAVQAPDMQTTGAHKPVQSGNTVVCFRQYAVTRPTANTKTASKLDLVDIGPNLDLAVRRCALADDQQFKQACHLPKEALAQLKSMHAGVSADGVGNLRGQLHVGQQDVAKGLALRKFKAHKRGRAGDAPEGRDDAEQAEEEQVAPTAAAAAAAPAAATGVKKMKRHRADEAEAPSKKRHRPGQGRAPTKDAISNVDM